MSFYGNLASNQKNDNRVLFVNIEGKRYTIEVKEADIEYDQDDKLLIFTDSDKYRNAFNVDKISSIFWDV